MNRRFPFACGQSGKLVSPEPRPAPRPAIWEGSDLRAAARQALSTPPVEPAAREFYVGSDGREYEVQR